MQNVNNQLKSVSIPMPNQSQRRPFYKSVLFIQRLTDVNLVHTNKLPLQMDTTSRYHFIFACLFNLHFKVSYFLFLHSFIFYLHQNLTMLVLQIISSKITLVISCLKKIYHFVAPFFLIQFRFQTHGWNSHRNKLEISDILFGLLDRIPCIYRLKTNN